MDTKTCGKCSTTKPVADFYQSNGIAKSWCKDCSKDYQKDLYKKDPQRAVDRSRNWREKYADKVSARRKENRPAAYLYELRYKYGLSKDDATRLLSENGSHCAVCGIQFSDKSKRSLDHCHETGKVRGFLCRRCNSVLGFVNDDQAILGKLAKYLGKHGK